MKAKTVEMDRQLQSASSVAPGVSNDNRNGKRRIVYLKDQPDARLSGGMCPSISCPGHCACVSKKR